MLTLAQALVIKTKNVKPPWRASQLVTSSTPRPASLLSAVKTIGEQRVLIFGRLRPLSVLVTHKTWAELSKTWSDPAPSAADFKSCLQSLSKALPSGCSIVYVSTDGQTVGISGKVGALSKARMFTLTKEQGDAQMKGWEDTGQGLGALAAGGGFLILIEAASGPAGVALTIAAFLSFVAAGALLGVGIGNMVDGYCPAVSSSPSSAAGDSSQSATVVGDIPSFSGFTTNQAIEELLLQLAYIDMTTIPDPGTLPGAGDLAPGDGDGEGPGDVGAA